MIAVIVIENRRDIASFSVRLTQIQSHKSFTKLRQVESIEFQPSGPTTEWGGVDETGGKSTESTSFAFNILKLTY